MRRHRHFALRVCAPEISNSKCSLIINCSISFKGDSGGAAVKEYEGSARLIGIISFGNNNTCGSPNDRRMHTRVPVLVDWIDTEINNWTDRSYEDWQQEPSEVRDKVWVLPPE